MRRWYLLAVLWMRAPAARCLALALASLTACIDLAPPLVNRFEDDAGADGGLADGSVNDGSGSSDRGDGASSDRTLVDTGPLLAQGTACTSGNMCASGNCVDGFCCSSVCDQPCLTCNLPGGTPGMCAPKPSATPCGAAACGGDVATGDRRCNGTGQCIASSSTSCVPFGCSGLSCRSACDTTADCAAAYVCTGSPRTCVASGQLLRWTFDEDGGGGTVTDDSGNDRTGMLTGSSGTRPAFATDVAPVSYPNPRSLRFDAPNAQAVLASPIPPSLRVSSPEMTMTAWIKPVGTPVVDGAAVFSLGGDFILRIQAGEIEWMKRRSTVSGMQFAVAQVPTVAHLDGAWHHVAGTVGSFGTRLYLDGVQIATSSSIEPTLWVGADQIAVGYQPGSGLHYYSGFIDDLRIYDRALSTADIMNLVRGNP